MPNTAPITVADCVARAIEQSGKTERQIAQELGCARTDLIRMLKSADAQRLSLGKVAALAGACNLDPALLLRLYLAEHHPPVWEVVQRMLDNALTRNEQALLALYRKAAPLNEIEITPEREKAVLEALGADGDTPGKGTEGAGEAHRLANLWAVPELRRPLAVGVASGVRRAICRARAMMSMVARMTLRLT